MTNVMTFEVWASLIMLNLGLVGLRFFKIKTNYLLVALGAFDFLMLCVMSYSEHLLIPGFLVISILVGIGLRYVKKQPRITTIMNWSAIALSVLGPFIFKPAIFQGINPTAALFVLLAGVIAALIVYVMRQRRQLQVKDSATNP